MLSVVKMWWSSGFGSPTWRRPETFKEICFKLVTTRVPLFAFFAAYAVAKLLFPSNADFSTLPSVPAAPPAAATDWSFLAPDKTCWTSSTITNQIPSSVIMSTLADPEPRLASSQAAVSRALEHITSPNPSNSLQVYAFCVPAEDGN